VSLGKQKSNSGVSKATNKRASEIFSAAQRAGSSVPTSVTGAQNFFTGAQGAGQQGMAALGGDVAAAQQFMNPFQQQVIDQMNDQFGVQNQMTMQGVNDAATTARAFGGSRHGIATGTALAENARNQGMQVAGLLNQGFEGAMGRAGQVAGMGFDAANAGANLGMVAGSPDLWRMGVLQRGFNPIQTSNSSGFNVGLPQRK